NSSLSSLALIKFRSLNTTFTCSGPLRLVLTLTFWTLASPVPHGPCQILSIRRFAPGSVSSSATTWWYTARRVCGGRYAFAQRLAEQHERNFCGRSKKSVRNQIRAKRLSSRG